MNIVSLDPYLTEVLFSIGAGFKVVGVSHLCSVPSAEFSPKVVTSKGEPRLTGDANDDRFLAGVSRMAVNIEALKSVKPTLIVGEQARTENHELFREWAEEYLHEAWQRRVRIRQFDVRGLEDLIAAYDELGTLAGLGRQGREFGQRTKSQLLDWGRNFYDRLRNKKVLVVTSVKPLQVAGLWVSDVVRLVSARTHTIDSREFSIPLEWRDLVAFAPDVLVVAPRGCSVEESVRTLKTFEAEAEWDTIPAVKRGEVSFTDGKALFSVGPGFLDGMSVLISAIAGLDSGYITKRDSFYRLRFVELQRHRFL